MPTRERTATSTEDEAFDVSILICTRNRGHHLKPSLEQMAQAHVPEGWRVELVVVDNGSSDATREVVEAVTMANMPVRYVYEPKTGKAHAYAAGLAAARGAVLLMTDDDTRVPPDWIEQMCRPILEGVTDAIQGGVRIAPHLERPWLRGVLRIWVAEVADPVYRPAGLVGANMAVSRAAMEAVGPFDIELGPGGSGFYEDTVFGWALEAAGKSIDYRPAAAVEHHFDADRLSLQAFLDSARRMAQSRVLVLLRTAPDAARPRLGDLLRNIPGLLFRSCTQAGRYVFGKQPDAGFVYYYYQLCLWRASRRQQSSRRAASPRPV